MLRLSRSLSRFETQDIKTQPQFNHNMDNSKGYDSEDGDGWIPKYLPCDDH